MTAIDSFIRCLAVAADNELDKPCGSFQRTGPCTSQRRNNRVVQNVQNGYDILVLQTCLQHHLAQRGGEHTGVEQTP